MRVCVCVQRLRMVDPTNPVEVTQAVAIMDCPKRVYYVVLCINHPRYPHTCLIGTYSLSLPPYRMALYGINMRVLYT